MSDNKENNKPKDTQKPTPSVLSINICDTVIRDELTKKISLIGLFNTIRAQRFPCTHTGLHVHVAMTNGHGKYKMEVRFSKLEEDKAIAGIQGDLNFQNPLQVVELNFSSPPLRFDKPGQYVVEVFCDGAQIQTRKFRVIGSRQKIPPTSGTEAG